MNKINEELKEALKNSNITKMKELIKKGADPNYSFKNKDKEFSLLHMAVFFEDLPYVKLLIDSGADTNKFEYTNGTKNPFGNLSPLQYSILNGTGESDNFKIINHLLKSESNAYLKNNNGTNSRDLAKYKNKTDKNKKYLNTIDLFYKNNKKIKEKHIEIANKNPSIKKKNPSIKKKPLLKKILKIHEKNLFQVVRKSLKNH